MYKCADTIATYKCRNCPDFQTECLPYLRKHMIEGHEPPSLTQLFYQCLICQFETYSKYLLIRHRMFDKCAPRETVTIENEASISTAEKDVPTNNLTFGKELRVVLERIILEDVQSQKEVFCEKETHLTTLKLTEDADPKKMKRVQCKKCPKPFSKYSSIRHKMFNKCSSKNRHEIEKDARSTAEKDVSTNNFTLDKELRVILERCNLEDVQSQKAVMYEKEADTSTLKLTENTNTEKMKRFQCEKCPMKFKTKQFLNSHVLYRHTKDEDINWFECEACFKKFKNKLKLKEHIFNCHTDPEKINWIGCDKCSAKFKTKRRFKEHIFYKHTKNFQWWECEKCPSKYKCKSALTRHIRCRHSDPKPINWFECHTCARKFKRKSNLIVHIKARHTDLERITWFHCEKCSAKFKFKDVLTKHIRNLHTESDNISWFNCEKCPVKFKTKENLKMHVVSMHTDPKNIKWFNCEQCPSKFKLKGYLKAHVIRKHLDPENINCFTCEQCSNTFKVKRDLHAHLRRMHPKSKNIVV